VRSTKKPVIVEFSGSLCVIRSGEIGQWKESGQRVLYSTQAGKSLIVLRDTGDGKCLTIMSSEGLFVSFVFVFHGPAPCDQ
jgi:hypothetical protein